jgi:hypothetical protein
MMVNLSRQNENGVTVVKTHRVHRLVADAWLPNPYNLPDVTHIDGNPQNNKLENLLRCNDVGAYKIIEKNHPSCNVGENCTRATISNEKAIEIYDMAHFSGL